MGCAALRDFDRDTLQPIRPDAEARLVLLCGARTAERVSPADGHGHASTSIAPRKYVDIYSVYHNLFDDVSHGTYINGDIFACIDKFYVRVSCTIIYIRTAMSSVFCFFGDK